MTAITILGRKLRGAWDLDHVLGDQLRLLNTYFRSLGEGNGRLLEFEDYDHWRLHEHWGVTKNRAHEIVLEFIRRYHLELDLLEDDALETMLRIKKFSDSWVVTARSELLEAETRAQVELFYRECFKGIFLTGHREPLPPVRSKLEVCWEIEADYAVDDSLSTILELAAAGLFCILFGDYRWNRTNKLLPHNVVRAYSLPEAEWLLRRRFQVDPRV